MTRQALASHPSPAKPTVSPTAKERRIQELSGFIVHTYVYLTGRGAERRSARALLGRGSDGSTFAVVEDPFRPVFHVRIDDLDAARGVLSTAGTEALPVRSGRATMDGDTVLSLTFRTVSEQRQGAAALRQAGIRTYEADIAAADPPLIDAGIHGSIRVRGAAEPGRHVDHVFLNPDVQAGDWEPVLRVLSLDIETDPRTDEILAIGLVSNDSWGERVNEVLLHPNAPLPGDREWPQFTTSYESERELLVGLIDRLTREDPDIITGWNVIDFDFAVIERRIVSHGLSFSIGRSREPARFLAANRTEDGARQNAAVSCQGRQIIDALRLVRYGPENFSDRKLGSVAEAVLGEGKTVEAETSTEKIATLLTLYRDDPVSFCEYCRKDAELVLRILDATGLLSLTLARCRLIGISLSRAWTSIPAFEFLYLEALHKRGMVGPTLGVDRLPQGDAPGGAIIKPVPGLHANVLVFDFKSLYPSIMRTFGIDPLGYVDSEEGYPEGASPPEPNDQTITAPNGARFSREESILPALLDRFWQSRDQAKRDGDAIASYVYKIIMNSFYGVLGSSGCRFAGAPLAGAITGFGQYILFWARNQFTALGMDVLYGDTDSLFVRAAAELSATELFALGERLCSEMNVRLSRFVADGYRLESRLELEFEKVYRRFYLPRIRHAGGGVALSEVRGRAKGYAGAPLGASGEAQPVEIKGMEAVRSDWTEAASRLQRELLALLFSDVGEGPIVAHIRDRISALRAGELDAELVYSRRLRKPVASYTTTRPPHVQAAALLPRDEQEGMIHYLITQAGPQPPSMRNAPIDHEHYLAKQLRPIADPICEILGVRADELFDPSQQLSLFGGPR